MEAHFALKIPLGLYSSPLKMGCTPPRDGVDQISKLLPQLTEQGLLGKGEVSLLKTVCVVLMMGMLLHNLCSKSLVLTGISTCIKENCFLSRGGNKNLYQGNEVFLSSQAFCCVCIISMNSSSLSQNKLSIKFAVEILRLSQKGEILSVVCIFP